MSDSMRETRQQLEEEIISLRQQLAVSETERGQMRQAWNAYLEAVAATRNVNAPIETAVAAWEQFGATLAALTPQPPRTIPLDTAIDEVQDVLSDLGRPDREQLNWYAWEIISRLERACGLEPKPWPGRPAAELFAAQPPRTFTKEEAQPDVWPVPDVLAILANAAEHLLDDHNCDQHGYESVRHAIRAARWHVEASKEPRTFTGDGKHLPAGVWQAQGPNACGDIRSDGTRPTFTGWTYTYIGPVPQEQT